MLGGGGFIYSFGLNLMEGNQNLMFPELIATQDTSIYITVFKCLGSHKTDEYICIYTWQH